MSAPKSPKSKPAGPVLAPDQPAAAPAEPRKSSRGRIIALLGVILLAIIGVFAYQNRTPAVDYGEPSSPDYFKSRMLGSIANKEYDDAMEAGMKAMHNKPEDAEIYQQLAVMLLNRAQDDKSHRERSIEDGISYIEKGLAARPGGDTYLFDSYSYARTMEGFGDLTAKRRCECYKRALQLMQSEAPILTADTLMLHGKPLQLAPMKRENAVALERLDKKLKDSSCQ